MLRLASGENHCLRKTNGRKGIQEGDEQCKVDSLVEQLTRREGGEGQGGGQVVLVVVVVMVVAAASSCVLSCISSSIRIRISISIRSRTCCSS